MLYSSSLTKISIFILLTLRPPTQNNSIFLIITYFYFICFLFYLYLFFSFFLNCIFTFFSIFFYVSQN
ncbi:MAG: hypothetical protein CVU87_06675 [Firmicutes bacterium HGW-Firmicutes-12]|nr:MAG: hypothetical protein CVU87_06675 [Firmicutes bacterium HGW-Firmicutes-12]